MKVLTISIAAYNVEKYLKETLDSLCDQRYIDDVEILVVDDGSKDATSIIGKKYQNLFPESIKYIWKENGGHGSTINKGIELASGKYFRVLDGDDYVDPDAFCKYIKKLKTCTTDLVITDYWWVDNDKNRHPHNHAVFSSFPVGEELEFSENLDSFLFGLSTLSIRTKLLKESSIEITEQCFYVDVEFIVWAIFLSKSFVYYNFKVYAYRCIATTQNSTNKANMLKNVLMQEKVALKLCTLVNDFFVIKSTKSSKLAVILNRIQMSIGAAMRTYLLCSSGKESRLRIKLFDEHIKSISEDIFTYTNKTRFFRAIRFGNYVLVPAIRIVYGMYIFANNKKH